MAWNKPQETATKAAPKKKPTAWRGAVAGGVCVAVAAVVAFFVLSGKEEKPTDESEKKHAVIKEVKPNLSTNTVSKVEDEHKGMVNVRGKWYPEYDEKGGKIWISANWVRYHTPVVYTNKTNLSRLTPAARIFDDTIDQDIADLMYQPLGAMWLGDVKYNSKAFTARFLKSLERPIIATVDDDEFTRQVKKAVNETKKELKARYDDGEDIAQIMTETRRELQKLGAYKEELRRITQEQVSAAKGDVEAQKEIFEAANKMLAERGIEPMKMPGVLYRNLKMQDHKQVKVEEGKKQK